MIALRLAPPLLACLLLAAHFYRAHLWPLALASALLPLLLAVPRPWAARAMQLALVAAALEWLRTLALFVAARIALGQPWLRLMVILLAVAVLTAASALVFRQAAVRQRFGLAQGA